MGTRSVPNKGYLIVDPKKHKVARICVNVWSAAIRTFAEQLIKQFPDDEERSRFAEAASADIKNLAYHLYCNMYLINQTLLIYKVSCGRKKAVKCEDVMHRGRIECHDVRDIVSLSMKFYS